MYTKPSKHSRAEQKRANQSQPQNRSLASYLKSPASVTAMRKGLDPRPHPITATASPVVITLCGRGIRHQHHMQTLNPRPALTHDPSPFSPHHDPSPLAHTSIPSHSHGQYTLQLEIFEQLRAVFVTGKGNYKRYL